jgi:Na+/H+ antiporter NhaD/arsenite permease-like protein
LSGSESTLADVNWVEVAVFVLVYLGMILGRLPRLALDRTGIALLGAIALVVTGSLTADEAARSVDIATMSLLFGLMVVSAQLRLGGFYSEVIRRLATVEASPAALLGLVVATAGTLSAVLANDIVCLAVTPLLIAGCLRRGLDPVPHLLGLACAANVGSAATLIGNPQNMLIGQKLGLSFVGYLSDALPPAALGCVVVWGVVVAVYRERWTCSPRDVEAEIPPFDRWQTAKGIVVVLGLVVIFLLAPVPREVAALAAAGLLLASRKMKSRDVLGIVDWHLLVLFVGLFVVQHAIENSGLMAVLLADLTRMGIDLSSPEWLLPVTVVLSNVVSNVPAVMLLLPVASDPGAGTVLALASTLAGNLLLVGSIANLIVVDQAARLGVVIGWREHARIGVPVTVFSLGITTLWLWL